MKHILLLVLFLISMPWAVADERLTVGGVERSYVLIGAQAGKSRPLVLALHGNWGTGAQFARYGQWEAVARAHDIVVALPDGTNRAWNDGRPAAEMMGKKPRAGIDDVLFLSRLVEHLVAKGIADKRHVFVTGVSNGGMMTYRLLCDRTDLFAAGAAVIANMPETSVAGCKPSRPVSVLIMNGTEDRLIPYEPAPGRFIGTERTAAFWRTLNGCSPAATREWLPDRDPEDGSKVERITYACPPERAVVVYRIENGGHQMPSLSRAFALEAMIGRRNHDIEGAEAIWAFFKQFAH